MKGRDFITLLGGAIATWPLALGAERGDRVRSTELTVSGLSRMEFSERTAIVFRDWLPLRRVRWRC